jgi:hypothetical protein
MVKLSEKQQRDLLIAAGLADFVTRGKITAVGYDALKSVVTRGGRALFAGSRRAAPSLGRFAGRAALRLAGTAGTIAMRHPVLTAGAIIYVNRDQAAELLREGYDVVSGGISELDPREDVFQGLDVGPAPTAPKKKKVSKYNRAVAAGMKAAKASVSYGKKGTLSSPKKAFAAVNRTASKIKQGKKVSTKGVIGKIARAARRFI